MPPQLQGSLDLLEQYALAEDRNQAATDLSSQLGGKTAAFLKGLRLLASNASNSEELAKVLKDLQPQNPSSSRPKPTSKLSAYEVELLLRQALQDCAAKCTSKIPTQNAQNPSKTQNVFKDDARAQEAIRELLELLRRPELFGHRFMTDFPVQYPDSSVGGTGGGTANVAKWPSTIEAPAENEFRPVTAFRNSRDVTTLMHSFEGHSKWLLVDQLVAAMHGAEEHLRPELAKASLQILENSQACPVSSLSPEVLTMLLSTRAKAEYTRSIQSSESTQRALFFNNHGKNIGQHATLQQLEALGGDFCESEVWQSAVLARLSCTGTEAAEVATWPEAAWDAYYKRLEEWGPKGISEEFLATVRGAVAHARVLRSFKSILDPSVDNSSGDGALFGCTKALAFGFAGVLGCPTNTKVLKVCSMLDDTQNCPNSFRAWTDRILEHLWGATVQGLVPLDFFFEPVHTAFSGSASSGIVSALTAKLKSKRPKVFLGEKAKDSAVVPMHTILDAAYVGLQDKFRVLLECSLQLLAPCMQAAGGREAANAASNYAKYHDAFFSAVFNVSTDSSANSETFRAVTHCMRSMHWINYKTADELRAACMLALSPLNPPISLPTDPLRVYVDSKNVEGCLSVRVSHIDQQAWFQNSKSAAPVDTDIDLTGVGVSEEFTVSTSTNPLLQELVEVEVPNTKGRRGCSVVDISAGGKICRAVIHRGAIHHHMRTTLAGHAFSLFYEDGTQPLSPYLIVDGAHYHPPKPRAQSNSQGRLQSTQGSAQEIFLPFPATDRNVVVVMCDGTSAAAAAEVWLKAETYALQADMPLDAAAVVPGCTVEVPIRASLQVNGVSAPLSLLSNVTLVATTIDMHGVPSSHSTANFALKELPHAATYALKVPEGSRSVALELTASVTCMARGDNSTEKKQQLSVKSRVEVSTAEDSTDIAHAFLTTVGGSYVVQVLGKCGEGIKHAPVTVAFKHRDYMLTVKKQACTDERGCVTLGKLSGIDKVTITNNGCKQLPGHFQQTWHPPKASTSPLPSTLSMEAGTGNWLLLPLPVNFAGCLHADTTDKVALVCTNCKGLPLHRHQVRFSEGGGRAMHVSGLDPGTYRLLSPPHHLDCDIRVLPPPPDSYASRPGSSNPAVGGLGQNENPSGSFGFAKPCAPDTVLGGTVFRKMAWGLEALLLQQPVVVHALHASSEKGIQARVTGGSGHRRAVITLARFLPAVGRTCMPSMTPLCNPAACNHWAVMTCQYLQSIELSDEARYVQERRQEVATTTPPSHLLLDKPSLLMHATEGPDAQNVHLQVKAGGQFEKKKAKKMYDADSAERGGRLNNFGSVMLCGALKTAAAAPPPQSSLYGHGTRMGRSKGTVDGSSVPSTVRGQRLMGPAVGHADLQFAGPALVVSDVEVNADGVLNVRPQKLPEGWNSSYAWVSMTVYSADGTTATSHTPINQPETHADQHALIASGRPRKDPRAARRLPASSPHVRRHRALVCDIGESFTVTDVLSSELTILGSAEETVGMFSALLRIRATCTPLTFEMHAMNAWQKFAFIGRWLEFSSGDKRHHVNEHACYELFLFVKLADREFFDACIAPMLRMRARSETDLMTMILLEDSEGLEHAFSNMHVVLNASTLECILAAAVMRRKDILRRIVLECSGSKSDRQLEKWKQERLQAALKHGQLSKDSAANPPEPPQAPTGAMAPPPAPAAPAGVGGGGATSGRVVKAMSQGYGAAMNIERPPPPPPRASDRSRMSRLEQEEEIELSSSASDDFDELCEDVPELQGATEVMDLLKVRQQQSEVQRDAFTLQNTKCWTEARYWMERKEYTNSRDHQQQIQGPLSQFWADYAKWLLVQIDAGADPAATPTATFLSPNTHTAPLDFTTAVVATGLLAASFCRTLQAQTALESSCTQRNLAEHSQKYDGCTLNFTAASPVVVFLQEMTVCEDSDDQNATEASEGPTHGDLKDTQKGSAVSTQSKAEQLMGYLTLTDPEFPTVENEETGEQQVRVAALPLQTWRVYTLGIVISNPSASQASVEVVAPCPEGAVPVGGRNFVDVRHETCSAFSCMRAEIQFYFPDAGLFKSPAVSIVRKGRPLQTLRLPDMAELQVLGEAGSRKSVQALTPGTRAWLLSREASDRDVLHAVTHATHALPAEELAWRCRNSEQFFKELLEALRAAGAYNASIWKFGFFWKNPQCIAEWLAAEKSSMLTHVGLPLHCSFLNLDRADEDMRLTEFRPLINPRAHKLAGRAALPCPQLEAAWRAFLSFCCRKPVLAADDLLEAAWFLVSMDRISDARRLLSRCLTLHAAAAPVATGAQQHACRSSMQRDYLDCYLTLAQLGSDGSPSPGGGAANTAAASAPVATLDSVSATTRKYTESPASVMNKVWEKRWRDMHDYVTELQSQHAAGAAAQDAQHAQQAAKRKTVEAFLTLDSSEVSTGVITALTAPDDVNLTSTVTDAVATSSHSAAVKNMLQVRLREIDVEMLFSRRPFEAISGDIGAAAFVAPKHAVTVPADPSGSTTLDLRTLFPEVEARSALVEVRHGELAATTAALRASLTLNVSQQRGLLTVLAPNTTAPNAGGSSSVAAAAGSSRKAPLAGAYVKVFAKASDGERFWRDGYTDTLGRFEYAASTSPSTSVQRFAVLVVSSMHGAAVKLVDAPSSVRK